MSVHQNWSQTCLDTKYYLLKSSHALTMFSAGAKNAESFFMPFASSPDFLLPALSVLLSCSFSCTWTQQQRGWARVRVWHERVGGGGVGGGRRWQAAGLQLMNGSEDHTDRSPLSRCCPHAQPTHAYHQTYPRHQRTHLRKHCVILQKVVKAHVPSAPVVPRHMFQVLEPDAASLVLPCMVSGARGQQLHEELRRLAYRAQALCAYSAHIGVHGDQALDEGEREAKGRCSLAVRLRGAIAAILPIAACIARAAAAAAALLIRVCSCGSLLICSRMSARREVYMGWVGGGGGGGPG
jgi:hypothetical protein